MARKGLRRLRQEEAKANSSKVEKTTTKKTPAKAKAPAKPRARTTRKKAAKSE